MASSNEIEERIQALVQQIAVLDAELRAQSWGRVMEIADELSVRRMRSADRRVLAEELRSIAAANLSLVQQPNRDNEAGSSDATDRALAGSPIDPDVGIARELAEVVPLVASSDAMLRGPQSADVDSLAAARPARTGEAKLDETALAETDEPIAVSDPTHDEDAFATEKDATFDCDQDEDAQSAGGLDERGRWRGDTAPVNVVQMLNAEMVYQAEDENDKDRYAAAAAQASLYDDPVAVIFPTTEELEAAVDEELAEEVRAERAEQERLNASDTDRTPIAEAGQPSAPGPGGAKPADPEPASGEPSISVGFSSHSRAERAILREREEKEARKQQRKEARKRYLGHLLTHREEDPDAQVVIPRGAATEAPDDLFVRRPQEGQGSARSPRMHAEETGSDSSDARHHNGSGHSAGTEAS